MPISSLQPVGNTVWSKLISLHDRCFSDAGRGVFKLFVIRLSIVSFAAHLGLIFLVRHVVQLVWLSPLVGANYLAAVATPFSVILFYEVITLIAAVPASTTRSIANQFEIVSLIFIRDVFKDFASAKGIDWLQSHPRAGLPMAFDMWSGLLMFLLATVFQQLAQRQVRMPTTPELISGREQFVRQKKVVSVGLTCLLLVLAAYHLVRFSVEAWQSSHAGSLVLLESAHFFYNDLFTVMIFTDVLLLILSLEVSGRYEMVFRNAAFVISIVLIRFSLTEGRPRGAVITLSAMAFGIFTLLIFNYHSWIRASGPHTIADDH